MKKNKFQITNFGFQIVSNTQKTKMVKNVFNSVAMKYDLMNDLMSFGIHRFWKYLLIKYSDIRHGNFVLDLAGGTGDLTIKISNLIGNKGKVILSDINSYMLKLGRKKIRNKGIINNVYYIQSDAENLPFLNEIFDFVIISFGLRNFTDPNKALKSIHKILKPGGQLIILEFSKPISKILNKIYKFYSFKILPKIGKVIVNDSNSYHYLVESIELHPNQESLVSMILDADFYNADYVNLTGGIVAIHRGYKF